jgi:protein SCO1/2
MKKIIHGIGFIAIVFFAICLQSCINEVPVEPENNLPLPIYPKTDKKTGQIIDANHKIRPFSFINQDSQIVTNATFKDKIYVADFFFIHCPTICPAVKSNMKFMYNQLEGVDNVVFLSHSIDTKYDTIPALKKFAEKLEIATDRWQLVTGDKAEIFEIAGDYNASALEGEHYDGGFDHSGGLVLIDKNGHIRSITRGTEKEGAEKMLENIKKLLKE